MANLTEFSAILTAERTDHGQLSTAARAAICGAVCAGLSHKAVAAAFGISRRAVGKTAQRFQETHSFDDKPGRGRPPTRRTNSSACLPVGALPSTPDSAGDGDGVGDGNPTTATTATTSALHGDRAAETEQQPSRGILPRGGGVRADKVTKSTKGPSSTQRKNTTRRDGPRMATTKTTTRTRCDESNGGPSQLEPGAVGQAADEIRSPVDAQQ
ncbi:Homeodomain-like protein [Niveomyces insectorum RCEF 264]|uniref:Homeodomain-like protein n=1 Tax=Niveomyces insectorum RCEF 264 TaxID=1081102 RepID=A0A167UVS5_9HYPO|nr:Homeodomain-like protein [Niveomyces insectorum RCEF 264]